MTIRRPVAERFWEKVMVDGDCWLWQAYASKDGYGQFKTGGTTIAAHRFAITLLVGPIPKGLECDHLCRRTRCVNPDHIELLTKAEHSARTPLGGITLIQRQKTHCLNGHLFAGANLYLRPEGGRRCRTCDRDRMRRYRQEGKR
jgi:hypothetical protein